MAAFSSSLFGQQEESPTISEIAPKVSDTTSMWWRDGFPFRVNDAPWLRRVQTGHYAFELHTESLAITHLGPLTSKAKDKDSWKNLVPAKLRLQITVDGTTYHGQGGSEWTRQSGPRLIESGRFVQRADVTDLTFVSKEGTVLPFESRFETVAWPKQLGLILHTKPKSDQTPPVNWKNLSLKIALKQNGNQLQESKNFENNPKNKKENWSSVFLTLEPRTGKKVAPRSPITVEAENSDESYRVSYDAPLIRHRINLDPVRKKRVERSNDALERVSLTLTNPTSNPRPARLCFEKTGAGFGAFLGSPITGVSAILCDKEGNPSGIPVQLSKNWHSSEENPVYSGTWFHASTLVHLPPNSTTELQLIIVCGHWGGLPAASHAQLSLIGWGSNQLWEQSALGSWGESVCYEPDQAQAQSTVTDVRPLMVTADKEKLWKWTANVGGGDFYRLSDKEGNRVPPRSMKAIHHRTGPCLTEVTYQGFLGASIEHATTVSIARTDDLVRATYRLKMKVIKDTDFSRLALFQVGSDTYNMTYEKKFAIGNDDGLLKEWSATWGGDVYQTPAMELVGRNPWVSLHEGEIITQQRKSQSIGADRGFIVRKWKAKLGGKPAQPWIRERGIVLHRRESSIIDLVPPPGLTTLQKGDYLEATIEHVVIPKSEEDYYGPNKELQSALAEFSNTWRMVAREAKENSREIEVEKGTLVRKFPDVRLTCENNEAAFNLSHGLGFVPVTFQNLTSHKDYQLSIDGKVWHQTSSRKDYWQSDFDPATQTWSRTYNLPIGAKTSTRVEFGPAK